MEAWVKYTSFTNRPIWSTERRPEEERETTESKESNKSRKESIERENEKGKRSDVTVQKTENRKQKTENRKQKTENRKQKTNYRNRNACFSMTSAVLPKLPGYGASLDPRTDFKKKQIFQVSSGLPLVKEKLALEPDLASELLTNTLDGPMHTQRTQEQRQGNGHVKTGSNLPAWVTYDRKVLRFFGFFVESVPESPIETSRIRKCVVYYYLEDDSVHVAEPKVENSGIQPGVFLKRHRIPKVTAADFYLVKDLNVGVDLTVYGRVFHIYDVDPFTRAFLEQEGIKVPASEECPLDAYTTKFSKPHITFHGKQMNSLKTYMEASLGKPIGQSIESVRKFLQNDRKVLRFYCLWDDTSFYGETRPYVVNYYLSDDAVEVLEVATANSGRDPFPSLLKKGKLPRQITIDKASLGEGDYYSEKDFRIGNRIDVYGRSFLIYGCDEFTKAYLIHNLGSTEADFPEVLVEEDKKAVKKVEIPPYNGYGTEEDSLQSVKHLVPKPPKKPVKTEEEEKKIVRFMAKMITKRPEDVNRSFVISLFVADDTISVFERPGRNSGFVGGKFLERAKIKNPTTNAYFKPADLFVGAKLTVNSYHFELLDATEFADK